MGKRIVTLNINDEKLTATPSKKIKVVEPKSEVQDFGIVEINNTSSRNKSKITAERGFEKHATASTKKSVKSKLVDVDYFDFDLRGSKEKTAKTIQKTQKTCEKLCLEQKNEKISSKKVVVSNKNLDEPTEKIHTSNLFAEVAERVSFDDDAKNIVQVARIGSLFDCEKVMIN